MDIVLLLHSLIRFVVLGVAVAGIVVTLVRWSSKAVPESAGRALAAAFVGLYDLQVLVGLLIILLGGLTNVLHPVVMFIGVIVAHGIQSMSKRAADTNSPPVHLALYVVPLAVILVGLALIGRLPA